MQKKNTHIALLIMVIILKAMEEKPLKQEENWKK